MSVDTLKHLEETVTRALYALVQDPDALPRTSGAFVQQPVSITNEHFDMVKKNNEANLEAFKGLKEKAEQALQRERDQEAEDQHNYMLDKQARVQEMNVNEDKTEEAKGQRAQLTEEKAAAQKELNEAQATKDADMKYLKVLITECTAGSNAWDHRQ